MSGGHGPRIRQFDLQEEDPRELVRIKEAAFGIPENVALWNWKYLESPFRGEIRVFVTEQDRGMVASTTRIPFDLRMGGRIVRAYFSVDSVVHPDFRRRGIMKELYLHTAGIMPVLYSKGTNQGMYDLLLEIGYRVVTPNTYLVNYLAPVQLFLKRYKFAASTSDPVMPATGGIGEFSRVERFGPEFDEFWNRVADAYSGIVVKDSTYMNWRYVDIPHREYRIFYKKREDTILSVIVLRAGGSSCSIVDMIWDPAADAEPDRTVRVWTRELKRLGFWKASCWATHRSLREALRKNGFVDRGQTPRFTVLAAGASGLEFSRGENLHFVDGDGDTEYL